MKPSFERAEPRLALCGLTCGLCPMYVDQYCPGCGGGLGNQVCNRARCSQKRPMCRIVLNAKTILAHTIKASIKAILS